MANSNTTEPEIYAESREAGPLAALGRDAQRGHAWGWARVSAQFSVLAPLVYAITVLAFLYPLAATDVAVSAALASAGAALLAMRVAQSPLRTWVLVVLGVSAALLSMWAGAQVAGSLSIAEHLGPLRTLAAGTYVDTVLPCAAFSLTLRVLSRRMRIFSLFEVLCVGLSFAQLVAAHRFGAINRPFELADSIIAEGGDPSAALLAIGAISAALILGLLFRERSLGRSLLHLSVALLLLLGVLTSTHMLGMPSPPPASTGLGLRPNEQKSEQTDKPGGQRKPRDPQSDNERLEFRDNYDSQGRQVPLAVVLLHDDYSPPTGMYYFRQTAFSQYNGKRLVSATSAELDDDIAPSFVTHKTQLAEVPNSEEDRVTLDTTVALLADHTRPFALETAQTVEPLENPNPGRFKRVYRATSVALSSKLDQLLGRPTGSPTWSEDKQRHYTQAPSDPRYAKLAQDILGTITEPLRKDSVARALAVSIWLSREGTYSLKSGHAQAEDPTADFLFGDRVGYCVHFAHAAVYLMRSLGVPARVGAGYVVEEAARQGGSSILLTGANSHAWPEFYVDGVGWVVADVSPNQSLDPPPPPPDPDLQRLLGEMARGLKPMSQSERRPLQPLIETATLLRTWLTRGVFTFALLGLVLLYSVKLWRLFAPRFAGPALPRLLYRAELDRFSEVALSRQFGETRERFAQRAARISPSFKQLTEQHLAAKWSRERKVDAELLRQLSHKVSQERRSAVVWWRRWLGALSPWSWLWSR
jgi:transglutaminase-like putative cysteine protease